MSNDILISIFPKYLKEIYKKTKNFEFRPFVLNDEYINIWVYETRPIKQLNTFLVVKKPVTDLSNSISKHYGLGDEKFEENIKNGRVGYEIISVQRINTPLTLEELKILGLYNAPQNYLKIDNYPKLKRKLAQIKVNRYKIKDS